MNTSENKYNPVAEYNTATVVIVRNPFDPANGREVRREIAGTSLVSVIADVQSRNPGTDFLALVNGQNPPDNYAIVRGDFVVVYPSLGKGGGGKSILGLVAVVALSVVAMGVGSLASGGAFIGKGVIAASSWGFAGWAAAAATMFLGSALISRFSGRQDLGNYNADYTTDPTYSWDGVSTMEGQNNAIALTYGTVMSGGQSIGKYVQVSNNEEYLNWLVAAGLGPLQISDVKVNENPVSFYSGMTVEIREGTNEQTVISNFNDTYFTKALSYQLNDNSVRTEEAQGNATEGLIVKLECSNGLYYAKDNGDLGSAWVDVAGWYRRNDGDWVQFIGERISGSQSSALRREFRIDHLAAGTYQVKMSVTGRSHAINSSRACTRIYWKELTSVVYDDFAYPGIALVGIKALATDQISGSPTLTFLKTNPGVLVWNPYQNAYETRASNNPAWAAYDVLHQCRRWKDVRSNSYVYDVAGVPANRILYDQFKVWADFCDAKRLYVNIEIATLGEMLDTINENIANVGRGQVLRFGTRYGCTFDCKKQPVQMFGMGNIIAGSFSEEFMATNDRANCVEITYTDAANDYSRETITIYSDNYDDDAEEKAAQATFNGITSYEQAYREGKYQLYCNQRLLRTINFEANVDAIACTVGDVVLVAHDVPRWAKSGRIHEVDGQFLLLPVELDETDKPYRVMYRTVKDNLYTSDVEIIENGGGWCKIRVLTAFDEDDPPQPNDVFDLAIKNIGSKPFVVKSITRAQDFTRRIECLEYDENVYEENYEIPQIQYSKPEAAVENVEGLSATAVHIVPASGAAYWRIDVSWERAPTGTYLVYADGQLIAGPLNMTSYNFTMEEKPNVIKVVTVGSAAKSPGTETTVTELDLIRVGAVENLTAFYAVNGNLYYVTAVWEYDEPAGFLYYAAESDGLTRQTREKTITITGVEAGLYTVSVRAITNYGESDAAEITLELPEIANEPEEPEEPEEGGETP